MQKITKGALAGGAAALLLIGGGSTLALWSDTEVINGGAITTGTVAVEAVAGNADIAIENLAPGGEPEVNTTEYTVALTGVDTATLEVQTPEAVAATGGLTVVSTATYAGQAVDLIDGAATLNITAGGNLTVTTTVSLDADGTDNQGESVTVTTGEVTVTQVVEPAEVP